MQPQMTVLPETDRVPRIGVIGTGFIARGLCHVLAHEDNFVLSRVLTRRECAGVTDLPVDSEQITNSVQEVVDSSDVVVECSGDSIYATDVLAPVMEAGIPVVTMDSELHVTTGSYLARNGFITEAEGDQPGSLAALLLDVREMGFEPKVFGNVKGFLNHDPSLKDMEFWSKKNGISLEQTVAFTDGTKVQIEQAFVANGLKARISKQGMTGLVCQDFTEGAEALAEISDAMNEPISDYVIPKTGPPGVFIVGRHRPEHAAYLEYYKLGKGPYYVLTRPFHLCHLEILKTVRRTLQGAPPLLNNSLEPRISVATIAKKDLGPGTPIRRGIGSFSVRGEAVNISDNVDHLPIGLAQDIVITKPVERGQTICFDDVELPETRALAAWQEVVNATIMNGALDLSTRSVSVDVSPVD